MPLLSFEQVSVSFGRHALLEHASFQIDAGERVCLIGRNGAGKSTLLQIVEGEVLPDSGEVWRQPGLTIASHHHDIALVERATGARPGSTGSCCGGIDRKPLERH